MDNINNIEFKRKLPIPMDIKAEMPLSEKAEKIKTKRDAEIADVFTGKSDKFLLIIGPCSADRPDSVLEPAQMGLDQGRRPEAGPVTPSLLPEIQTDGENCPKQTDCKICRKQVLS